MRLTYLPGSLCATISMSANEAPAAQNAVSISGERDNEDESHMIGIYGGGVFQEADKLTKLSESGFNTLICWSVHINTDGDLIYNNPPAIAKDGAYTGPAEWPGMLADALSSSSTLESLHFSVGSWGSRDFLNIRNLITIWGIGDKNPLHKNFSALKKAIPHISTIDLDNEDDFHPETLVKFCILLHSIGFKVTFCPYNKREEYWTYGLTEIHKTHPGLVVGYNLQCYAGGERNADRAALSAWIQSVQKATGWDAKKAAAFIRPGLWCKHENGGRYPMEVTVDLTEWKSLGLRHGWLWVYDDVLKMDGTNKDLDMSVDAYASAIMSALCS